MLFWEQEVAKKGRLPVVNFAAGGIATPADAALMMQLGVDGEGENPCPIPLILITCPMDRLTFTRGVCQLRSTPRVMFSMTFSGVFVGSGIFKSANAAQRAKAIVQATTHYNNPKVRWNGGNSGAMLEASSKASSLATQSRWRKNGARLVHVL